MGSRRLFVGSEVDLACVGQALPALKEFVDTEVAAVRQGSSPRLFLLFLDVRISDADSERGPSCAAGSTDPLYFYVMPSNPCLPILATFLAITCSPSLTVCFVSGQMSYFGLGNPPYHNLTSTADYTLMHLHSSVSGVSRPKHLQEVNVVLQPGYFCIAGSMLQPVYNAHAPGNRNAHYEFMYRYAAATRLPTLALPERRTRDLSRAIRVQFQS
eukprot:205191-Rhodomonas_salina.3